MNLIDYNKDELKKIFNEEIESNNSNDEICLITRSSKDDTHIKLLCNHGFNYINILNEVINQKKESRYNHSILKVNQIKCPYCRNIQDYLLPHIKGFPLVKGVNSPKKYGLYNHKCCYIFKKGKNKDKPCNSPCNGQYCNSHEKIINKKK